MIIIEADQTNLLQAAVIHSVSWQESHRAFCSPDFIELHTPDHQLEYISKKISSGSRFYMLVEDVPVGIISVTGSLIEDLYILPDKQNMGYGTTLLQFAIGRCNGTPTLWILENNDKAKKLYHRLGFRETGTVHAVTDGLNEIELAYTEKQEWL